MAKNWPLHQLLAFGGNIGAYDVWTCGLKTIKGAPPGGQITIDEQEYVIDAIVTYVKEWWNDAAGSIGAVQLFDLRWVKFNAIGHDGKYFFPTTTLREFTPVAGPVAGGQSARDSQAQTLIGGDGRGRGHYGRFYPPPMFVRPDVGSPYIPSSQATALVTRTQTLINHLYGLPLQLDNPTDFLYPANVSPGDSIKGTNSVARVITEVQCDRVPDTQRRRTNKVPRLVVSAPIPTP